MAGENGIPNKFRGESAKRKTNCKQLWKDGWLRPIQFQYFCKVIIE